MFDVITLHGVSPHVLKVLPSSADMFYKLLLSMGKSLGFLRFAHQNLESCMNIGEDHTW